MASITIRSLDDDLKRRLRVRSAEHGRSMEEEARSILRATLAQEASTATDLAQAIHRRFQDIDDTEIPVARREAVREPPDVTS